jgi:hypothetical protein
MKLIETAVNTFPSLLVAAAISAIGDAHAAQEALPTPRHLSVADHSATTKSVERVALRYVAFWNTGDDAYAKEALADDFVDRT